MVYITGDTHIPYDIKKIMTRAFPEQKEMTKDDFVIICGDFGAIWYGDKRDEWWLKNLSKRNFTTLFVDGNHENFNVLNNYPVTIWNGGKVHQVGKSVYHLMRGQVFTIEDKKFFTMGGALSVDKHLRKENVSWWEAEIPSNEECYEAIDNLDKHNWNVDYIITHTAPKSIVPKVLDCYSDRFVDPTASFLQRIYDDIAFKKWYFGHFHVDVAVDNFTALYNKIEKIN